MAWDQGLAYLHDTFVVYGTYPLAVVLLVLGVLVGRRAPSFAGPQRLMLLLCAVLVAVSATRIGGDGRHYRYLAFS